MKARYTHDKSSLALTIKACGDKKDKIQSDNK
jgi:hypothetical protein